MTKTTVGVIRVGLYLRISKDQELIGAGIERQLQDTDRLTRERGWIGEHYIDNNVSAYQSKKRPEFERLMADLASGKIQGIVVYDIDRLARQPRDVERLLDLYASNKSLVFATCQGKLDLGTSDGQFMIRLFVSIANKSSADTARRVARAHLQRAQEGAITSGCRAFGWAEDKVSLDPVEAPLLRRAAEDVLGGLSLNGIVNRWNNEGVTTAKGGRWLKASLRMMLLSPRLAGYRVHRDGIAMDLDGRPVMGPHAPIVTIEQWESLRAIILDPSRSSSTHMGGRKYLLAGLIRCGGCTTLMTGNARPGNTGAFFYTCKAGCRHNNIDGLQTDDAVRGVFTGTLAIRGEESGTVGPWSGEKEYAVVQARIDELKRKYDDPNDDDVDAEEFWPMIASLKKQRKALEADKAKWRETNDPIFLDIDHDWDTLTIEQQRALLAKHLITVAIAPTGRRGIFDPERIEEVWKPVRPGIPASA